MHILINPQFYRNKIETAPIVLNTDFMSELVVCGTGARFKFMWRPESRRGGDDIYIVDETAAAILTAMNTAYFATGVTFNVYDDFDITKAPVATIFNVAEISRAYEYWNLPGDHNYSVIEVNEKGSKIEKYLVNAWFTTIPDLAGTGTTTTTSTTTTTTTTA